MSDISQYVISLVSAVLFSLVIYHIGEKGGYRRGYQEGHKKAMESMTLTAEQMEQIKEIIESNWHDLAEDYGMGPYWSSAHPEDDYDWQKIADELNDMLGFGGKVVDE